ncbi:unnamed protein product [Chrysoparadoxa australica]
MMGKVDTDNNGTIDFDEFCAMMQKCEVETDFDTEIKQAFLFFDKDKSGAIDTNELGEIMRGLGAKLSDEEINLLVREADTDGDGQIDVQVLYALPHAATSNLVD